ncbi:cupin domain-containing protein [Stieleria magnilauensis]
MQLDADAGLDVPAGLVCMYVITHGSAWLKLPDDDQPPTRLTDGDHVILTRSQPHQVVAQPTSSSRPIADWLERPLLMTNLRFVASKFNNPTLD